MIFDTESKPIINHYNVAFYAIGLCVVAVVTYIALGWVLE